jgi:hypothetical protein
VFAPDKANVPDPFFVKPLLPAKIALTDDVTPVATVAVKAVVNVPVVPVIEPLDKATEVAALFTPPISSVPPFTVTA